jgi:chromate reductase, NAD(P)H dehydrogenase (quinone)
MKILAFGASNSKNSINQKLAKYTANEIENSEIEILDLSQFDLPIYSVDRQQNEGIPTTINDFIIKIESCDLMIISLAEHNGTYTTAFKNLFDWASRAKQKTWEGPKMLLLSTSPGARGGLGVLEAALSRFPYHGANIIGSFSLPNFGSNFDEENGILDEELANKFQEILGAC